MNSVWGPSHALIIVLVIPSPATSSATKATNAVAKVSMSTFILTVSMNSAKENCEYPRLSTFFASSLTRST